jgi:hypothetical protein
MFIAKNENNAESIDDVAVKVALHCESGDDSRESRVGSQDSEFSIQYSALGSE